MAPNTLSPASIVIDYHSAYAPHKMTIPTKEWFPTSITGTLGSYEAWNGDPIDAEDMINSLLDLLKVFLKTNAAFDAVTIYTQATATSPNIPRSQKVIPVTGTATTGDEAAVSATWNMKSLSNGDVKLVLLDTPVPATWFNKIKPADFSAGQLAVADELADVAKAWSARDDTRPAAVRSITYDLNDKLQKMYFK